MRLIAMVGRPRMTFSLVAVRPSAKRSSTPPAVFASEDTSDPVWMRTPACSSFARRAWMSCSVPPSTR
ncbi:MAG: hypothetical protein WDN72_08820 [Alphaproteobacteria bacterium]